MNKKIDTAPKLEGKELNQEVISVIKWLSVWLLFLVIAIAVFSPFGWAHPLSGFALSAFVFVFFAAVDAKKGARPTKIVIVNIIVNVLVLVFAFFMLPTNSALEKLEEMNQPTSLFEHLSKSA
ncbi:hypothetical protein N5K32_004561 [Vibrio parahaemolyticus]|nr:hypothetical protein [Vibrio parahaemolyticus]EHZ2751308.1 hypothetical protein [Vibrio parahaemolyticus]EJG2012254.1 hypothetical protein [Vibrio parahaemolyticus]EJK2413599.1 hypothetical protein [Vibrio parahaemolyticus]EJU8968701.1 hypothetical protein [Vibrio parahaemolyticus]